MYRSFDWTITVDRSVKNTNNEFIDRGLVDSESGEDLFANGTFNSDDIDVLDISDHRIEFAIIEENDINLIEINTIA